MDRILLSLDIMTTNNLWILDMSRANIVKLSLFNKLPRLSFTDGKSSCQAPTIRIVRGGVACNRGSKTLRFIHNLPNQVQVFVNQYRKHKGLVAFLILLLLSNSSLALESLSHNTHQYADSHEMHSMHDSSAGMELRAPSLSQESSEDCVCDAVCCPSSIDFGFETSEEQYPGDDSNSLVKLTFYQSISLDLLLPPPTL